MGVEPTRFRLPNMLLEEFEHFLGELGHIRGNELRKVVRHSALLPACVEVAIRPLLGEVQDGEPPACRGENVGPDHSCLVTVGVELHLP